METTDEYRERLLLGARLIARRAAEVAKRSGVTLTKIEWLHGHEVADQGSSSLKLESGNKAICRVIPSEWIENFHDEGEKGPVLARLRAMIETLSRDTST